MEIRNLILKQKKVHTVNYNKLIVFTFIAIIIITT